MHIPRRLNLSRIIFFLKPCLLVAYGEFFYSFIPEFICRLSYCMMLNICRDSFHYVEADTVYALVVNVTDEHVDKRQNLGISGSKGISSAY